MIFLCDMLINFNTGLIREDNYIYSRREIAKDYLKGWFWLDMITSIPFDKMITKTKGFGFSSIAKVLKIFRIARLLKLLRMLHLAKQLSKWGDTTDSSTARIRLVKFSTAILITGHTCACFWVGIANFYRLSESERTYDNFYGYNASSWVVRFQNTWQKDVFQLYLRAIYFTFTTLTTVGYGDISPVLPLEVIFTIFLLLGGSTMFGFIIGNVASLMTREDEHIAMIKDKMATVSNYMKYRKLPDKLATRIRRHYEYSWKRAQTSKESEILAELPHALRTECALFIHGDVIAQVDFLKNLTKNVKASLVTRLKPLLAAAGEEVVTEDLFGNEMYVIWKGKLNIVIDISHFDNKQDASEVSIESLTQGGYFCDYAIIMDQAKHPASVKADANCDLLVLPRQDFLHFGEEFPLAVLGMIKACKDRYLELTSKISKKREGLAMLVHRMRLSKGTPQTSTHSVENSPTHGAASPTRLASVKWALSSRKENTPHPASRNSFDSRDVESATYFRDSNVLNRSAKNHAANFIGILSDRLKSKKQLIQSHTHHTHETEVPPSNSPEQSQATIVGTTICKFHPAHLMKILAWKNRAQICVAMNQLARAEVRHMKKFQLGHEHSRAKNKDGSNVCDLCSKRVSRNNQAVTYGDLARLESSMKEELYEVKALLSQMARQMGLEADPISRRTRTARATSNEAKDKFEPGSPRSDISSQTLFSQQTLAENQHTAPTSRGPSTNHDVIVAEIMRSNAFREEKDNVFVETVDARQCFHLRIC